MSTAPSDPPTGPLVKAPLPKAPDLRVHAGRAVRLEPYRPEHLDDLWAASDPALSWTYLRYGPFDTREAMGLQLEHLAARPDLRFFVVCPSTSGRAEGWASYCAISPADAAIEIGGIWFSPSLQRTRAATEALSLLLHHAFDDLGYRRVAWRCNALNAASIRAAERLGFKPEGVWRDAEIVKGRRRSTAWFSLLLPEWPAVRDALATWLDDASFDEAGRALTCLSTLTRRLD